MPHSTVNTEAAEGQMFITQPVCARAAELIPTLYNQLVGERITERKALNGTLLIWVEGELIFTQNYGEGVQFAPVAAGKEETLDQSGASSSGQAATVSAVAYQGQPKWEGAVTDQGITVAFSGAEQFVDAFYARAVLGFLIMMKDFFRSVLQPYGPGGTVKNWGDPIGAADIVAQALHRALPTGVQNIFPVPVAPMAPQISTAIVELTT